MYIKTRLRLEHDTLWGDIRKNISKFQDDFSGGP